MTPISKEQIKALKKEIGAFSKHPLDQKHTILDSFPDRGIFVYTPDNEELVYLETSPYTFCAVLLQKLKDALQKEGFQRREIYGVYRRWRRMNPDDEGDIQYLFNQEPEDIPEVTALLRTINNSEVLK